MQTKHIQSSHLHFQRWKVTWLVEKSYIVQIHSTLDLACVRGQSEWMKIEFGILRGNKEIMFRGLPGYSFRPINKRCVWHKSKGCSNESNCHWLLKILDCHGGDRTWTYVAILEHGPLSLYNKGHSHTILKACDHCILRSLIGQKAETIQVHSRRWRPKDPKKTSWMNSVCGSLHCTL